MKDAPLRTFMTRDVMHIPSHTSLYDVATIMSSKRLSCLVVTEGDKPVGIITERDMVRILVDFLDTDNNRDIEVNSYMTHRPLVVSEETSVMQALEINDKRNIRHLPIVDSDGDLAGLVTHSDLIRNKQDVLQQHDGHVKQSVLDQTRDLRQAIDELQNLSLQDPLLKIGNRRAMEQGLHQAAELSARYGRTYSVILLDIDYFKKYNDYYGHGKGDDVLQRVAYHLQTYTRKVDNVYRYGGEEFLILLPETGLSGASVLSKRIVEDLFTLQIPHKGSPYGVVTTSAGIASHDPETFAGETWQQLVSRADQALYMAKEQGRNRYAGSEAKEIPERPSVSIAC